MIEHFWFTAKKKLTCAAANSAFKAIRRGINKMASIIMSCNVKYVMMVSHAHRSGHFTPSQKADVIEMRREIKMMEGWSNLSEGTDQMFRSCFTLGEDLGWCDRSSDDD